MFSFLPIYDNLYTAENCFDEANKALTKLDQSINSFVNSQSSKKDKYDELLFLREEGYEDPFKKCCGKPFYTEVTYKIHLTTHLKCDTDGCDFSGDSNLMHYHKISVHEDNLIEKVDLEKESQKVRSWIMERKRNYPTREKKEAKEQEIEAKIERGQLLISETFSRNTKKKDFTRNKPKFLKNKPKVEQKENSDYEPQDLQESSAIPTEDPLAALAVQKISENDESKPKLVEYSSEEEEVNEPKVKSSPYDENHSDNPDSPAQIEIDDSVDCQVPIDKGNLTKREIKEIYLKYQEKRPFDNNMVVRLQSQRKKCMNNLTSIRTRPTLLKMLLADEIRSERNRLLQCIRFVVNNNFFKKPPRDPAP